MQPYDIIIAGAGPAGLTLAADLSRDFRVLVVEKGRAATTTRAWYTFQDRIKNDKLEDAVVATPGNGIFYMDEESQLTYKDRHALINEDQVLGMFKERAESNGCTVLSNNPVSDFSYKDKHVVLKTKRGSYKGKLLIDAMGVTSPLVRKRKLQKYFNIWAVYGARMKARYPDPDTLGFFKMPEKYQPMTDKTNYMFGVYPKGEHYCDAYLFNYYDYIAQPEVLKGLFQKSIKEIVPRHKTLGVLRGWIYSGELKKYALDRVLFVGDAGGVTPPAIGMGFNESLKKHMFISYRLKFLMEGEKLSKHALSDVLLDYRNSTAYTFQRIIQKYFYYGNTAQQWKDGIDVIEDAGKFFTKKWMRHELDGGLIKRGLRSLIKVIGFTGLVKMMPLREFLLLTKDVVKIGGKSLLQEAHIEYHKHYGKKTCVLCMQCKCPYTK